MPPPDITRRIEQQFPQQLDIAGDTLSRIEHLGPRVVRCVIYLAEGDLQKLQHYAGEALDDPRDVMYWAEYDTDDTRLRNFNEPF